MLNICEKAEAHFKSVLGHKYNAYCFRYDSEEIEIWPTHKEELDLTGEDQLLDRAIDTLPVRIIVTPNFNFDYEGYSSVTEES